MRAFILCGLTLLLLLCQPGCRSGLIESVLEVKGIFWERVIYLEEYTTVTKEEWVENLPPGVKKISSKIIPKGTTVILGREDYNETEKYQCGSPPPVPTRPAIPTKYCERTVKKTRNIQGILPEDRELVTYEDKEWKETDKSKALIANGDETKPPTWNESQTDTKTTRLGRRTEFYSIKLETTTGNQPKTYDFQVTDFEEWQKYQKGQKVLAKFFSRDGNPLTVTRIN